MTLSDAKPEEKWWGFKPAGTKGQASKENIKVYPIAEEHCETANFYIFVF